MFPVKFLKDKAIITLNAKFYDLYPVTEACERFKDACRIKVLYLKNEKIMKIKIEPKEKINLEEFVFNFCNFALHTQVKGT